MEGLIPLVYRAIVEYRKASGRQVAIGSCLLYGDHQKCDAPASSTLFCDAGWYAASPSPAASPPARGASLVSPLLRSASRRHFAG
uniref:Uncharacterized protein n=1 Tax=Arundo donax TaxID=35708 RepID=A0A0A9AK54_ARUDO